MNSRTVRLGMVLVWLGVTGALATRSAWVPADLLERFDPGNLSLGAWVALGLTLYNLVRLLMTRRPGRGSGGSLRETLKARRHKAVPEPRNPDLDFTGPADPAP